MPYPIDQKLVVAVASGALFDLSASHKVYLEAGIEEYRKYQEANIDNTLAKGVAFPFIKRLLNLNHVFNEEQPVEVVLLSRKQSRNRPQGVPVYSALWFEHYPSRIFFRQLSLSVFTGI